MPPGSSDVQKLGEFKNSILFRNSAAIPQFFTDFRLADTTKLVCAAEKD